MGKKNTDLETRLLTYLKDYTVSFHTTPSVRELAHLFACSPNNIQQYLKRFEEEGLIERKGTRSIIIHDNVNTINNNENNYIYNKEEEGIPIIGIVGCSLPKEGFLVFDDYLPINKNYLGKGEYFALYAKGDSMINAGIEDGDLIIIEKNNRARNNDIVLALVEGEVTLKRLKYDAYKNIYYLHPENSEYLDMYYDNIEIEGVAKKIIKNL